MCQLCINTFSNGYLLFWKASHFIARCLLSCKITHNFYSLLPVTSWTSQFFLPVTDLWCFWTASGLSFLQDKTTIPLRVSHITCFFMSSTFQTVPFVNGLYKTEHPELDAVLCTCFRHRDQDNVMSPRRLTCLGNMACCHWFQRAAMQSINSPARANKLIFLCMLRTSIN